MMTAHTWVPFCLQRSRQAILPTLIAWVGDPTALRFLEFFTVNIRNQNTRAAYARAAAAFLRWTHRASSQFDSPRRR